MPKGACRERAEEGKPRLKPQSSQSYKTEAQRDCSLHPVPGWTRVGPGHKPSQLPAALLRPTAPSQPESLYLRLTFQGCPPTPFPWGLGKGQRPQAPWRGRGKVLAGPKSARFSDSEKDARIGAAGKENHPWPCRSRGKGSGAHHLKELHGHKAESLLLEALDDLAHQAALHAVGLDSNKGALRVGHGPVGGR